MTHEPVFAVALTSGANDIRQMSRGKDLRVLKFLLAFAIAAAMAVAPALAQTAAAQAAQCVAIADDAERLACYDALFRADGEPAEAIVVQSARMIPAQPTGRDFAKMTLACPAEGLDVSFEFAGQLVSNTGDIAAVTFQLDQGGTTVRTMSASEDNRLLRFASARDAGAFVDGLEGATNLKVRMTPVRQRSVTVDFRLPDVAEQIAALRAGCR